ncbi:MAG TPA: VOC family protein [Caulobacterales bacterium]|jgi:catechol 2,3-dioxygenase-like lactoylglutathione lyase family enzyme|nr:VOC family protein [Caulobacterales bacterium]
MSETARVKLEHVNLTVSNPEKTAAALCAMFDWRIRWQGLAASGGQTIHVGGEDDYLAVYTDTRPGQPFTQKRYAKGAPLNHIGVVVPDLEAAEARVAAAGFRPFGHGAYEPGRRFYFLDDDGIEFEVVSYAPPPR